jgi:hypothetical protein
MDLTASIVGLTEMKTEHRLDGMDIINHVVAKEKDFPRSLYWRLKRGENIRKAVREGQLKYIYDLENGEVSEYLFDLLADPSEETDLKIKNSEDLNRLKSLLAAWEQEVQPERYNRE